MKKMEQKGVSPIAGAILLIAINVTLAAAVAMLVSGFPDHASPLNALLSATATRDNHTDYTITISHEGGDDLAVVDLQVLASDSATTFRTYDFPGTGTFSVGNKITLTNCSYRGNVENKVVSVFIIHKQTKLKILSATSVVVT